MKLRPILESKGGMQLLSLLTKTDVHKVFV